ncbi:MAG: DUF2752 domain-containing protein [Eubacterium sp.]|nr:DUF2752 domain-containing protein [Eubacterium sp.]
MIQHQLTDFHPLSHMYPCLLHSLTGCYCPGCGGTRAVAYLLTGKWLRSFWYYPLVPAVFVWYAVFMVTYTIEKLTHGKISVGVRYHDAWLWAAIVVIAANCAVKNLALIFAGYAMIP